MSGPPGLQLSVLGSVEVTWNGAPVDIGGFKSRALVARLLVDRGLIVSVDQFAESLWSEEDHRDAAVALRSTVSRLRKRLRAAGVPDKILMTRTPGYVLDLPANATDAHSFEELVAEGRRSLNRGSPAEAARVLLQAEGLWRGPAYGEVRDEPFARAEARRLEEHRLTATELRMDAELTMGHHRDVVGELESLTGAHPLRERLWSQWMLGLYRSGRQAEALRVYQDLRAILVTELGIEPGHDVAWMEHAILTHDPVLDFRVPTERSEPRETLAAVSTLYPPEQRSERYELLPFAGRDDELGRLWSWWDAVRINGGRCIFVEGEPGVGKSRLVTEFAVAIRSRGDLVLYGRCDEDPVTSYQPFAEALTRHFQSLSADRLSAMPAWQRTELSRLVVRLRDPVPGSPDTVPAVDPPGERLRFFEAVTITLAELAAEAPVLLVVDDLQYADDSTVQLLRHVIRRAAETRVGVVGTYVDAEISAQHPLRQVWNELRPAHAVETLHLGGLPVSAVEQVVAELTEASPDFVSRLYQLTAGNPLYLDELLRPVLSRGTDVPALDDAAATAGLGPTEAVHALVSGRTARMSPDATALLEAAAVVGREFELYVVAETAEVGPERLLDALDEVERGRLVHLLEGGVGERYAFAHGLAREAIYQGLPRARRARYHHRLALVLERVHATDLDGYVTELAHHFAAGANIGDAEKAVHYGRAAGLHATRALAFEEALEHFTRAWEVTERFGLLDAGARCDLLVALADARFRANNVALCDDAIARAEELARECGDAGRLAEVALRAGWPTYLGIGPGPGPEQVRLVREALDLLPAEDSARRALLTAWLSVMAVGHPRQATMGELHAALELNATAETMARRLNDPTVLGHVLSGRLRLLWGVDSGSERMATAVELGEIADEIADGRLALLGHMWRLRELLVRGDLPAVRSEIERTEGRHTGPLHPLEAAYGYYRSAMMALIRGDFEAAEVVVGRASEVSAGYPQIALSAHSILMWWTWWQRDLIGQPDNLYWEIMTGEGPEHLRHEPAFVHFQAERGETEQALDGLHALLEKEWVAQAATLTEALSLAMMAATCGTIGAPARGPARDLYAVMSRFAGTVIVVRAPMAACLGPADFYLGMLAATMGDHGLAEVHFEAALSVARRLESPPFEVAARIELARTLRRRRPEEEAERVAELLRHGEESARSMGLRRLERLAAEPD